MTRLALRLALVALFLVAGPAHADTADDFYAAVALDHEGKHAEAVAAHEAIVARDPADPFADDALIEAARLYEEKLGEPRRAALAYERLVREYPESRLARRAERRAQLLREGLGADGHGEAALAAWNTILNDFPSRTRRESLALALKLLAEHPDFPQAARVQHWIGEQHEQLGEHAAALATYREVEARWPGSEWALRARRSQADVLVLLERWDEADAIYTSLRGAEAGAPFAKELGEAVARLRLARRVARLEVAALVALALLLAGALATLRRDAGSFAAAGRALLRPPLEVIYLLPVAALIAAAGQTENESIALSTLWMSIVMLVVTWISGTGLVAARAAAGRLSLPRLLAHGGGAALAMLAAAFVIVHRLDLLDFIIHTVIFGHD